MDSWEPSACSKCYRKSFLSLTSGGFPSAQTMLSTGISCMISGYSCWLRTSSCWALVERLSVGRPHALVVERSHLLSKICPFSELRCKLTWSTVNLTFTWKEGYPWVLSLFDPRTRTHQLSLAFLQFTQLYYRGTLRGTLSQFWWQSMLIRKFYQGHSFTGAHECSPNPSTLPNLTMGRGQQSYPRRTLLWSVSGLPSYLQFKTVRETFASYGSSQNYS